MVKKEFLESTFLGSLLLFLYRTNNITEGNISKYWKKLHKKKSTLQEIVDFIEADKKTELDLSQLVLVSQKDGKYSPLFTGCVKLQNEKYILPIADFKYSGILEHLYEEGVTVHFFEKNKAGKWYATSK